MRNIKVKFQNVYQRLDIACQAKFSKTFGGIESYIRQILCFGGISSASIVASKLREYSSAFKRLSEREYSTTIERLSERDNLSITKSDILWLNSFRKKINCKKDPLSRYLNCH